MSKALTDRQKEVLTFIHIYIQSNSFPPSIQEISDNFHITVRACHDHLKAVEKKGYISRGKGQKSRSIKITSSIFSDNILENKHKIIQDNIINSGILTIPILGLVQAGLPVLTEENYEGSLEIPKKSFGVGKFFALKVRGDSMIEEGIIEGDLGVIRQQTVFENGEIVVAQLENGITLKKAYKEKNRLRLEPANINYQPILTRDAAIIGKLVGIIRNY